MGQVHRLVAAESAVIDKSILTKLRLRDGERKTRDFIDLMIFEATDTMCQIETALNAQQDVKALELTKELIRISASSGMICMNDVAYDLTDCIESKNEVASKAVLARLLRVGEESLFTLIDYTDRTMV